MPNLVWLLVASIGPGLLWLWFFYRQDRYEHEPFKQIAKIFVAGLLLVIPAGLLEQMWRGQLLTAIRIGNWPAFLVMAFLVISLIEEGLKSGFLLWLIGRNRELNEPVDGIIYGITLGLGFASFENYIWASAFGIGVAILRALVTTLAHASFTGWMGYYLSRYKFSEPEQPGFLLKGFLVAFISHGLYDFLLFLRTGTASLLAFIIVASLIFGLYRVIQTQVASSPFRK